MAGQNQTWAALLVVGMALFVAGFSAGSAGWVTEYGLMGGGLLMAISAVLKAASEATQQEDSA